MVLDVSNALIQTKIPPNKDGEEKFIIKITGVLVDMILKMDSETYMNHVVYLHGNKSIYVVLLREIYGMLVALLLFYNKFCVYLEDIVFEFNPYNPCVYNKIEFYIQHTVRFHVDDVMSSHVNPKFNDIEVELNRGRGPEYLGISFDFTEKSKVKINMDNYVEMVINDFPMKIINIDTSLTPTGGNFLNM